MELDGKAGEPLTQLPSAEIEQQQLEDQPYCRGWMKWKVWVLVGEWKEIRFKPHRILRMLLRCRPRFTGRFWSQFSFVSDSATVLLAPTRQWRRGSFGQAAPSLVCSLSQVVVAVIICWAPTSCFYATVSVRSWHHILRSPFQQVLGFRRRTL